MTAQLPVEVGMQAPKLSIDILYKVVQRLLKRVSVFLSLAFNLFEANIKCVNFSCEHCVMKHKYSNFAQPGEIFYNPP